MTVPQVSTCLWFADQAEPAAMFYTGLVPGSAITGVLRHGAGGLLPQGTALTVSFHLAGRAFTALNGGMEVPFTHAHSMVVACQTQAEIDALWDGLLEGGTPQQCGWLTDRYGLSWQIVPAILPELLAGGDAASARAMAAMMGMVKLDIATLEAAHRGV
ncbi:VOC family protein [Fertoebacter nigrum]|uniref:VOC family protein n=1 Tax=Fertoeibacter niger TaxID=2656921 RepID=A0A8X8KLQ4_9RHOB|nr:VOC family protein [Fertoeibacter niger]NUB45544.1 VOC family protein [Fertoeibacter niger]